MGTNFQAASITAFIIRKPKHSRFHEMFSSMKRNSSTQGILRATVTRSSPLPRLALKIMLITRQNTSLRKSSHKTKTPLQLFTMKSLSSHLLQVLQQSAHQVPPASLKPSLQIDARDDKLLKRSKLSLKATGVGPETFARRLRQRMQKAGRRRYKRSTIQS